MDQFGENLHLNKMKYLNTLIYYIFFNFYLSNILSCFSVEVFTSVACLFPDTCGIF